MSLSAEIIVERRRRAPRGTGAMMAGGNPNAKRGRSENDFYATPDEVTDALLRRWGHHVGGTVWEPCAGNGKMSARILGYMRTNQRKGTIISTDIEPQAAHTWTPGINIGKLDLFDLKAKSEDYADRRFDCIITNPPFDIAADIIHHIFTTAEPHVRFVALLLKATYWHAASRHRLFRAFPPAVIAPLLWRPDFLDPAFRAANPDTAGPTMEFAWNLWVAGNVSTMYEPLERAP